MSASALSNRTGELAAALKEVRDLSVLVEQRNEEIGSLLSLLEACEWDAEENCPVCRGWKTHDEGCKLSIALNVAPR